MPDDIADIAAHFATAGRLVATEPFPCGHIHDSYLLDYDHDGSTIRYLLQRINGAVFPRPVPVMENIQRVTAHIAQSLRASGVQDVDRRVLTVIPTREGEPLCSDDFGHHWRMYSYVRGVRSTEVVQSPAQAEQAGRAFGAFQRMLVNLPGPRLHETIPDFHNTPKRCAALDRSVRADAVGRVSAARAEIEFAQRHRSVAALLVNAYAAGEILERIVHNDAKIGNVLFDEVSGEALCVVDLDTVMPGLALYDFGDMVRTMTTTSAEDQADLTVVEVELPLFEALARGYLEETRSFLTKPERLQLVLAGRLITLEQGVRFLTDFLSGDHYYKTQRPEQNLDRCRVQFKLVESIIRQEKQMNRLIEAL